MGGADMGEGDAGEGQAKHVTTVAVEYRRTYTDRPDQWGPGRRGGALPCSMRGRALTAATTRRERKGVGRRDSNVMRHGHRRGGQGQTSMKAMFQFMTKKQDL